jgi:two-component system, chemotaxis family, chemotaxis protein CheY
MDMGNEATKVTGGRGLRIVCADDNALLVELLGRLLTTAGHHPLLAHDGREAWEAIRDQLNGIDVVITDHQMPHMNGLELVRRLRAGHFAGQIIVHSSSLNDALRETYSALGVAHLVTKGCRPDELLKLIPAV